MKRIVVLTVAVCWCAPLLGATRERGVALRDRLGEFALVVVGKATRARVETVAEGQFVIVATIKVEEVIKGAGAHAGEEMAIAWSAPTAYARMVQIEVKDLPMNKALWYLHKSVDGVPVPYTLAARYLPGDEVGWEALLTPVRERAKPFAKWQHLQIDLVVEPLSVTDHLPAQATVLVQSGGDGPSLLPSQLAWTAERIQIELKPGGDPMKHNSRSALLPRPGLLVVNARPLAGQDLPRSLSSGFSQAARLLVRPLRIHLKEGQSESFWCVAKLMDDNRKTLVASKPVRITIRDGSLTPDDLAARDAISIAELWPFVGPTVEMPTAAQLQQLEALSQKYGSTVYGPALQCGLVFAGVPSDAGAQITKLEALTTDQTFGFADDCRWKLASLYLAQGDRTKAEALYTKLLEDRSGGLWRAAIMKIDP